MMFVVIIISVLLLSNIIFSSLYISEIRSHKKTISKYKPKIAPRSYDPFDVDYFGGC